MSVPVVLLVEDNPITRKLVRFALQQEQMELVEAVDAKAALELTASRRPDLILQDLLLPDMDGFALAALLREQPRLHGVPILAFSGLLSQLDEKRIAGAGFTDFVTKPIEPSKLVRLIRAHLPSTDTPKHSFGNGRRVVLVDDDDVQRKLSVFKLARLGFDVVDAADGHAALAAAQSATPAAIITDAMMPGLDGFGLCAAVRQDPALKDVPIVMLTSTYVDEADRELGRLAGANAFVIRTPALSEMITALQDVLSTSAAAPVPAVHPPEFERERASRAMVQLERQAAAASSARQQCATLSAELAVLNAISEAITQDTDIDVVLREILAACCDSGGVSLGALYLKNSDGSFRTLMVGSHAAWASGSDDPFRNDCEQLRTYMQQRSALRLSKDSVPAADRAWLERCGLQSALIVPLHHKDDTLGAMVMMSESADISADDRLLFAEAVGHQVSVALALTQAFEDTALAAQTAREQSRLLQSVFGTMTDPIMVVNQDGQATMWNSAAEKLIKVSKPEPLSLQDPELSARSGLYQSDRTTLIAGDQLPLARALRGDAVDDAELYVKSDLQPDGAWIKVTARPLVDESGSITGAVGVSRDVTKERLANEQLMISDRMASIGMMAAGVGHEINNPLSAVVANLEMASAELAALAGQIGTDKLGDLADEIRDAYEAAQRVRSIAADLKVFSSAQADQPQAVDVEHVLESAARMGWNQVRHRARLVKQFGGVPPVAGVEARLGQVFLNLIVNAAQAIAEGNPEGNEIRLRTRVGDDKRIVIDVEDTGAGIPPQVMSQLFTPFVTTKPVGVGTGLGLSICQRLVNMMGGDIWAESTIGRGTTFHVALLPADARSIGAAPKPAAAEAAVASRARILVVDDEEILGTILRRLFKAHDVTVLTSARDALERIDAGARFDAILCDVMMPIMTGIEFHRALSERHPDQVRALFFLTGGAFNKETATFLDAVANPRVEKPFDAAKLRARVEAHLAARPTPPTGEAA
jgi:CheY-like chemotaxis protein/PAS domain-containing protein